MTHTPGPWHHDQEGHKADARLIAAAPDLLEALRLMVGYQGHGKSVEERINIAKAAIAKATESPE